LANEEKYNLVIIIDKEMGNSYNKAAELVNQMVFNKLEEVHCVITDL